MSEPSPAAPKRPRWKKKRYRIPAAVLLLLSGFVFVNNSSLFAPTPSERPQALAHRGAAQTFDVSQVEADTCTAAIIDEPEHDHLENTVEGIRAAFEAGAAQVEFDVQWTKDGQFAVFHDWELDCRTDGSGPVRDRTMAQLRQLDVGYGYTADGGASHPFRGEGVGLMPTLDEVLEAFPGKDLLLNVKSEDAAEGEALARRLAELSESERADLAVYGGNAPIAEIRRLLPQLRTMSVDIMKDCLLTYEATGWTGLPPSSCRNTQLHIPEGYAPWLWGWPVRFDQRMAEVGSRVVLVAGDGGFSEGFDTASSLERIPTDFVGLVWTNRVGEIAPLLAER